MPRVPTRSHYVSSFLYPLSSFLPSPTSSDDNRRFMIVNNKVTEPVTAILIFSEHG